MTYCRLSEDLYQTAKVAKILLLLNAGKGKEFKGKSLEEVHITDDDVLDLNTTTNENVTIDKNDDGAVENCEIEYQTNANRRYGRTKWSKDDKKLVLAHFKEHIRTKRPPKKQECLDFISSHSSLFTQSDWVRIKTLVFNTYRIK